MNDQSPTRDGRRVTTVPPSPDHPGAMEQRDRRRAEASGESDFVGGLDTQGSTGTQTAIVSDPGMISVEGDDEAPGQA